MSRIDKQKTWVVAAMAIAGLALTTEVLSQSSNLYGFDPETRIYVVQPGDTMWGIAEKAYEDPWKWPRVWENNPAVENPHRIYPDGQLVLPYTDGSAPPPPVVAFEPVPEPATQAAPAEVSPPVEAPVAVVEQEPEPAEMVEPQEDQNGALILKDFADEAGESRLEVHVKPDVAAPSARHLVLRMGSEGMLVPEENRVRVSLMGDETARTIFAKGDKVYLSKGENAGIQRGTRYYTYEKYERLQHPASREDLGLLVKLTGVLEVVDVSRKSSTAIVRENFDVIDKNQYLMEYVDRPDMIVPNYATSDSVGLIVRTYEQQSVVGANQVVYVDLGTDDGLENGTMLNIYRDLGERYDRIHKEYSELPRLALGLGVVLDAGERASTVLIVKSLQEIGAGDAVQTVREGG